MDSWASYLVDLASWKATAWRSQRKVTFGGVVSLETDNSLYQFHDAIFVCRARRPYRSFEAPRALRGLWLVGFLDRDGEGYALGTVWSEGAHAVMFRPDVELVDRNAFVVTSATVGFSHDAPLPDPRLARTNPNPRRAPRRPDRLPLARPPLPPSMTRLHVGRPR